MNSCELVTLVSSFACALAKLYPPEELAVIAAVFTQLGDTLETIQANEERCQNGN